MAYKSRNGGYHKETCDYATIGSYRHVEELPEYAEFADCVGCEFH